MARVTSAISCFRSFSAACSFGVCALMSISPFAVLLRENGSPALFMANVNSV